MCGEGLMDHSETSLYLVMSVGVHDGTAVPLLYPVSAYNMYAESDSHVLVSCDDLHEAV